MTINLLFATAAVSMLAALSAASGCAVSAEPIHALIVTGHNNHNWQYTSRMHKDTLEATGKFAVDITDAPATALADAKALAKYKVVILDYNDSHQAKRWGEPAEATFLAAVRGGLGVVSVHSANNAFNGWADYERMIGLMWREGTGHGKFHEFEVKVVDAEHPVFKGLPTITKTSDELYHKLVNSQKAEYKLLASAMSAKETGGTGNDEPMALTLAFGSGRVFHTPLGHVWTNSASSKVSVTTPTFRSVLTRGAEWAATGSVTLGPTWSDIRTHNVLTDDEKSQGWELLFDGKTSPKLRGWKKDKLPGSWKFDDGTLHVVKSPDHAGGEDAGDICTLDQYKNFEFECEWKVGQGGNSGIMYHCTEDHTYPWETGPEMQILDDERHQDGKKPQTTAGSMYDIFAPAVDSARPPGEWNRARIVCKGTRVEHWLNGFKVVDTDTAGKEFTDAKAKSKWPGMPDYATRPSGFIALQDHGDEVAFRNIKVRKLAD
ncbi:MAG: family 16 glycoside hydrolase [Planctomycetota bacterium]